MKNVVLIGFMGTGKTTVGQLLAQRLDWSFVDLDQEIESQCKMTVRDIFANYGEAVFRQHESAMIKSMTARNNTIISTGGGAVLLDENIYNLRQCGPLVALKAQPEVIVKRVESDKRVSRPLLNRPDRLETVSNMLHDRRKRYAFADISIDTDYLSPDEVANKIEDLWSFLDKQKSSPVSLPLMFWDAALQPLTR